MKSINDYSEEDENLLKDLFDEDESEEVLESEIGKVTDSRKKYQKNKFSLYIDDFENSRKTPLKPQKNKFNLYVDDFENQTTNEKEKQQVEKKVFNINSFLKIFVSKLSFGWTGKKDYLALTKEESKYEYTKTDNLFIESLKKNVDTAKQFLENGYIIPNKLHKALLNEILLNNINMFMEARYLCFKNTLFHYQNRGVERIHFAKKIEDFYCENKIGSEVFLNSVVLTSNNFIFCNKYITDNLLQKDYEELPIIKLIYQAVESSSPDFIWKQYKEKKISIEVMGLIVVKYKDDFKKNINDEFIKDIEVFLEKVFSSKNYHDSYVLSDYKNSVIQEKNLMNEFKKISFEAYNKKASDLLNELKGTALNNAIKNQDYGIIGKEFNNDEINSAIKIFETIVNDLNKKDLNVDFLSIKSNIEKNMQTILINNLLLKDLQNNDFSFNELKEQINVNIKELSNIYDKILNNEMTALKNDLKVKKRTL